MSTLTTTTLDRIVELANSYHKIDQPGMSSEENDKLRAQLRAGMMQLDDDDDDGRLFVMIAHKLLGGSSYKVMTKDPDPECIAKYQLLAQRLGASVTITKSGDWHELGLTEILLSPFAANNNQPARGRTPRT